MMSHGITPAVAKRLVRSLSVDSLFSTRARFLAEECHYGHEGVKLHAAPRAAVVSYLRHQVAVFQTNWPSSPRPCVRLKLAMLGNPEPRRGKQETERIAAET